MFFAVGNDVVAGLCGLAVLEQGDGLVIALDHLEIGLIVLAVGACLHGEVVSVVVRDARDDLLLHDTVDAGALAALEQVGDEYVAAVDDDGKAQLLASSEDVDKAVEDGSAVVFIPDIRVVHPEAVDTLSLEALGQLVDAEVLPGHLGGVDPSLRGPVGVLAQRILFKAVVVGTVGGDGADAQIGIDLAAAGFEPLDLGGGIVLRIDDDLLVVLDLCRAGHLGADEDTPFINGCCLRGSSGPGDDPDEGDRRGQDQSSQTAGQGSSD